VNAGKPAIDYLSPGSLG